jgi:hypothetical protein
MRGVPMVVTQEVLREYLDQARRYYGVEVTEKTASKFMRLLATLMFFNKSFLNGYITTIGTTIYWPNLEQMYMHPDAAFGTLFHEVQHAVDYRRASVFFVGTYLGPQILFLLALLSLLALALGNLWLLWLLAILFLLPLPSIGRAVWEMRGTSCGIAMRVWENHDFPDAYTDAIVDRFTGPDYYYMLPSRKLVMWLFSRYKNRVLSGKLTEAQKFTYTFLERHGMVSRGG